MNDVEILEIVSEVFKDVLELDHLLLTPNTTAAMVDGWDSLSNVRAVIAIEQKFNVKFTISEITGLKDIGELMFLIRKSL